MPGIGTERSMRMNRSERAAPPERQGGRLRQRCCAGLLAFALGAVPSLLRAQALAVPQPSPGLMPNPAAGKTLYGKHCARCHGQNLMGTVEGPPFLHKIYEPAHHGDAAFQRAVKFGVRAHHWGFGDMPPVAGLTPDDVAQITAHIRARQRRAGIR